MRPVYSACRTWASKLLLVSLQCDGCPTLLLSAPLLTCAVPNVRWSSGRLWPLAATEGAGQSLQVHWCFLILSNMGSLTSLLRTPPLQVGEFPGRTEILTPKDLGHCQGDDRDQKCLRAGERGQLNQGHLTTFSNQPQLLNPHSPLHSRELLRKLWLLRGRGPSQQIIHGSLPCPVSL